MQIINNGQGVCLELKQKKSYLFSWNYDMAENIG